jgi:ABC-type nitrate/sulfonate/bicarbonate transport system permease component
MTHNAVSGPLGTPPAATLTAASGAQQATSPAGEANRGQRSRRSPAMLVTQVIVIGLAVVLWQLVAAARSGGAVPSPATTFNELAHLFRTGELWTPVRQTATTWLIGIAVCTGIGIPLGLLIGSSKLATNSTRLTIDVVRNIPPVALVPLGLLLWGPNRSMVLLLVVSGTIWPIVIQSIYAARQTEPQLRDVAQVFHLGRRWWLTHIFLPGVTPFVMTGLRVAATICLLLTVTGELFGGAPGVGTQIQSAQIGNDNPQMYAYVIVAALLGLLGWHPSFRKAT